MTTPTPSTLSSPSSASSESRTLTPARLLPWLIGLLAALMLGTALTFHTLGGGITGQESITKATTSPAFPGVLTFNLMIGFAGFLFVTQTGWRSLRVLLTVIAALIIGYIVVSLITPDASAAFNTLLFAPIGRLNRWGRWMEDAMALVLIGLTIAIVFRAQLFSLGAEGQIFMAALAAGFVAINITGLPSVLHIMLAVSAAMLVGFLTALIPGLLRAYLGASELVSTLMLNQVFFLIYEFVLTRIKPADKNFLVSADFPESVLFPNLVPRTNVTLAILLVIGAVIAVWVLIQRTPLGYAIRMVGLNPRFARYGGIKSRQTIVLSMGISGMVAGLTSAYMAIVVHEQLNQGISSNLTFEGVVVALLARNNPLAVPAMALLYSYLRTGGEYIQIDAGVSFEVVRIIQAIIILLFTAEGLTEFLRWRQSVQPRPDIQPGAA